ncbi:MAG TPA: response regulator [Candidatus Acidoferrales bacterium]|nr:response regulator [Candidatus Acidoferrales bacterium]
MPRILVADDNSNIQKMVTLAFQDHGIEVVAVGNGEAAVRRLLDINPDVVLADVFMPVRNGYELCEFIKTDPKFSKVPVILLVGAFDPLDEAEARRVGADGILKKPFVPPDPLIAMVTAVMAKAPKQEPKAAAPEIELPKPPPPAPPPVMETFPEPTPEEEAYAFGTGRRSLDDDEDTGGSRAAQAVLTPAAAASTQTATSSEDDATFTETGADWKRRDQVDSEAVPSFAPALIDDFTEQNSSVREAELDSIEVGLAPDAATQTANESIPQAAMQTTVEPAIEAPSVAPELNARVAEAPRNAIPVETEHPLPSSESLMNALAGAFADATATPTEAAIEDRMTRVLPRSWAKPLEDSFQSTKGLTDLMGPALADPGAWTKSEEVAEAAPTAVEEPAAPPTSSQENRPVQEAGEATGASLAAEPAAPEIASSAIPPAAVLAWESNRSATTELQSTPSLELDSAPAQIENSAPEVEPPPESHESARAELTPSTVADAFRAFSPVTPSEESAPVTTESSTSASSLESPSITPEPMVATTEPAPVAPEEPTVTAEAPAVVAESPAFAAELPTAATEAASSSAEATSEEEEPLAPPVAILESAEIVAREIGRTPTVETAAEASAQPQVPELAAQTATPVLAAEAVSEPAASGTATPEATPASAGPGATAPPNVDEVVAKVLEKLGPQLQELLSKSLVRPLVEDLLHKPDDEKK